jgi:hypothetical protein
MTNDQNFQEFQQAISPWLSCYQNIDIVYLAGKTADINVLRYCRVILNPGMFPNAFSQFRHESKTLIFGSTTIDYSADWLQALFKNTRTGPITIGSEQIHFMMEANQTENYTFYRSNALGTIGAAQRIPGLQISGGDLRKYLPTVDFEVLNWELRSANPPYDDVTELLTNVDIRRDIFSLSSPVIDVIALPPALVGPESDMADGKTRVQLLASGKADPSKISLSYKVIKKGQPIRKDASLAGCEWTQQAKRRHSSLSIDTEHGEIVHLFLKFGGEAIHHWWLRDPAKYVNPYLAAYECYDGESTILKKMLFNPRDDSIGFEVGVALLLNMLGFGTSHFGIQENFQKGPDIVAVIPGEDALLVIECTTGLLDQKDKLAKLVQRTQALRDALVRTGYPATVVYSVIVSALPREHLAAHFNAAHDHNVSVVAKEELEQWFERRISALKPKEIFEQLSGLVPPAPVSEIMPIAG